MAMLTVRNLPDDVHRALRAQAVRHGRSTEAEVREILANAVPPQARVGLGDALDEPGRKPGLTDADCTALEQAHNTIPAKPVNRVIRLDTHVVCDPGRIAVRNCRTCGGPAQGCSALDKPVIDKSL